MTTKTIREIALAWKSDKQRYVKQSTYAAYVLVLENHILPSFGDCDALSEKLVQEFVLQKRYAKIVFSGETALYLHGLIDREYSEISVTVPPLFNRTRLCEQGIIVHQDKTEVYELGIMELETSFGNKIRTYDKEKCICDMLRRRNMEVQHFQTASYFLKFSIKALARYSYFSI